MANVTLVAEVEALLRLGSLRPAAPYSLRPSCDLDLDRIGSLYFRSYEVGEACETEDEAIADVAASFAGEYGEYLHAASPVAVIGTEIVAAAMTVECATWDDVPSCPFLIELFTREDHRRRVLATALVCTAAAEIAPIASQIALRVQNENEPALALYASLGFRPWGV